MTDYSVRIAFNQGSEKELSGAFPEGLSASPLPLDHELRRRMVITTGFHYLDYVFLALVFATGFGLKKFLEGFASEAGKKLAVKLFSPIKPENREKKIRRFAKKVSVPRESVRYDIAYIVVVRIEADNFDDQFSLDLFLKPPTDSTKLHAIAYGEARCGIQQIRAADRESRTKRSSGRG